MFLSVAWLFISRKQKKKKKCKKNWIMMTMWLFCCSSNINNNNDEYNDDNNNDNETTGYNFGNKNDVAWPLRIMKMTMTMTMTIMMMMLMLMLMVMLLYCVADVCKSFWWLVVWLAVAATRWVEKYVAWLKPLEFAWHRPH